MVEKEYIDRDAAINAMCRLCSDTTRDKCSIQDICNHVCRLEAVPAAEVRPVVRGKWISNDDGETIIKLKYGEPQGSCFCSVCHEWLVASDEYDVKGNFCPNCGADMRNAND